MSSNRLLLILLCSLILAVLAGVILLLQYPESSSVEALLSVERESATMAFLYPQQQTSPLELEQFQQTQIALLRSEFVLKAALTRSDIAQLEAVRVHEPDPVAWLQDELEVSFRGGGELLEVRYEGTQDEEEMKKVIDAVVEAFKREVIVDEQVRAEERKAELTKLHHDLSDELEAKMDRYNLLHEELSSEKSARADDRSVATGKDLDTVNTHLRDFLMARDDAKDAAALKMIASLRVAMAARPEPSWAHAIPTKPQQTENVELAMLKREINQLSEHNQDFAIRVRKLQLERQYSDELFRVLQPAIATTLIDDPQSYRIATGGGLLTFVAACLGLMLVGPAKGYRIAALVGFASLIVAGLGLFLIIGFE